MFLPTGVLGVGPEVGGEWGLVASAVFKTVVSARKRRKVGSIPTRLRHRESKDVRMLGCGSYRPTSLHPYCFGASVRKPIFTAPPSCAASMAATARSNGI